MGARLKSRKEDATIYEPWSLDRPSIARRKSARSCWLVIWACCWRCISAQPWRYRRSGRRRWIDHVCRAQEEGLHLAFAEEEARPGQGAPQHLTHRGLPCLRPAQAAAARLPELCRLEGKLKCARAAFVGVTRPWAVR